MTIYKEILWKSVLVLSFFGFNAQAAAKPNLVLLPIDVSQQDVDLSSEYGSALQEGLQSRYTVFYGAAVEKELEKEYSKLDCNAETCNQNIAIAFNGELIADASVKAISVGYLLKLVIRNVLTSEISESQTVPCRKCDSLNVVEKLKKMGRGSYTKSASSGSSSPVKSAITGNRAILLFDTQPTGAAISINGKSVGTSPYQGVNYKMGDKVLINITKENYRPQDLTLELQQAITQLNPIVLEKGQGQVLITSEPFKNNTTVYINGQEKGIAPLSLLLAEGTYDIQLKTNTESTQVKTVAIKDNSQVHHIGHFNLHTNQPLSLQTSIEKMSYGIGMSMARSVKGQPIDINISSMLAGLNAAYNSITQIYKEEEIKQAFSYVKEQTEREKLAGNQPDNNNPMYQEHLKMMSYGIGMSMARSVKGQPVDVKYKQMIAGLKDILENKPPRLDEDTVREAFAVVKAEQLANQDESASQAKKEGNKYLLKNSKKFGVHVTDSGLQYEVLVAGNGPSPKATDTVEVHYHGTSIDGTVFDSSVDRGTPANFPVNRVISGWTEALQLMRVGDKWRVHIPANLAYGEESPSPKIPANSTLVFEIELLDIKPKDKV